MSWRIWMFWSRCIRAIIKETSRRPRNRNQYLYVRSTGPGCWGNCPTATQGGEWLSRKIPGAALWTSSAHTAWRRRPRWIVCLSELFLGNQKWRNRRERGLDCMEGDWQPPIWISARVPWLCWPYEALHCRGAEWLHRWACLVVSVWSLGERWSRFASNAGHSLLFRAAGSLSEGGRLDQRWTSA